jgi:DnaJ like chaperone protein
MDPLAWLGLRKDRERAHLVALHQAVSQLLPDDEPVVVRYIVVIAVLLTKIAQADGVFVRSELERLQLLFEHIDRMPPQGVASLCRELDARVRELDEHELATCYRELKCLCDASERLQVMRLLAFQATADGRIAPSEHGVLVEIAAQLDITAEAMQQLEVDALSTDDVPLPPRSIPPSSRAGAASRPR